MQRGELALISDGELRWLRDEVMPKLGIARLSIGEDLEHTASYPDIWANTSTMTITVTKSWSRFSKLERKAHLLHECLHLVGMEHNEGIGYNSHPAEDTYSWRVGRELGLL